MCISGCVKFAPTQLINNESVMLGGPGVIVQLDSGIGLCWDTGT